MNDCIFCKIINRQVPSQIVEETEDILVIKDISPKSSIHYLIIPKKHIKDLISFNSADFYLGSKVFAMAKELSKTEYTKEFKLILNNGPKAGQQIFHIHAHFLAGQGIPKCDGI